LAVLLVPAGLVGIQPDLGTALLILTAGLFVVFLAGIRKRYIFGAILAALAIAPFFWLFLMHDYQRQRVLTLLDPQADKPGAGRRPPGPSWTVSRSATPTASSPGRGRRVVFRGWRCCGPSICRSSAGA